MNNQLVGLLSVLAFDLISGVSPVVTKFISFSVPSFLLVAIRFSFAAVFLFLFMLIFGKWKKSYLSITKKQLIGLLLLGTVGSGIASWLNVVAIRQIGAALTTILVNLEIPLGILFAVWFLGEKVTKRFLILAVCILFGVVLVTSSGNFNIAWSMSFWIGISTSLLAAILWGACTIIGKVLLGELSSMVVAFYRFAVASVFNSLIVFILYKENITNIISGVSMNDWLKLLYLGMGASAIALVLYYTALKRMEVKQFSLLVTLPIAISVILGVISGERFLIHQWIGAFIIISGIVVLVTENKKNKSLV